ncbi:hypothetical protein Hte_000429 [Hypoxylon texense]
MSLSKCAVCWKEDGKACASCKSCCYCSKECQKSDWKSHKLLCHAVANEEARPTPSHVRAIFFPEDKPTPELVWIRYTPEEEVNRDPGVVEMSLLQTLLMRNAKDLLGQTKMTWNPRLKQFSSRTVEFHYRDNFYNDGSRPTASIHTAVEPHGPETRRWRGPVLVLAISREEPSDDEDDDDYFGGTILQYTDVTLTDFRAAIDYSLCYREQKAEPDMKALLSRLGLGGIDAGSALSGEGVSKNDQPTSSKSNTSAATGSAPNFSDSARDTILGVQIDCDELGSEVRQVSVPLNDPIRNGEGEVSPISRRVGMPLRLRRTDEKFSNWENQKVCVMMMNIDVDHPMWGLALMGWINYLNNVMVIREDGRDLTRRDLLNFHAFCGEFVENALPLFGSSRATKQAAMVFLTPENYQNKITDGDVERGYIR